MNDTSNRGAWVGGRFVLGATPTRDQVALARRSEERARAARFRANVRTTKLINGEK